MASSADNRPSPVEREIYRLVRVACVYGRKIE